MAVGFIAMWSHWRRSPLQLFTLIAGLALATGLWCGVQAINSEARASYAAASATLGEGQYDQLVPKTGGAISQALFVTLRRAGWLVSPVLEGTLNTPGERIRVVGIDPLTAPPGLGALDLSSGPDGAAFDLSTFLSGQALFANAPTAKKLTQLEGYSITLAPRTAPDTIITDIAAAQRLLGQRGEISRLIVARVQPVGRPPLAQIAPDLTRQAAQGVADAGRLTDSFHLNLTAFGMLSFAVGLFIVHSAVALAFEQRRPMVRTLRALGIPLKQLMLLMAVELGVIALLSASLGIALGYVMAAALMPNVAATLQGLYGAQVSGELALRPSWWVPGLAIALGGTAVAASGTLWRIAKMPLLASAQPRAWSMVSTGQRNRLTLAAAILLIAAAGLAQFGHGLVAGFALLACLLVGAALALPVALNRVLSFCQNRAQTALPQWFWADTRQQLPGLSLALMALLLAMAANIGVSTMVSSFRTTFIGFLDQRLASELYVSTENAEQGARLPAFLGTAVREILPILSDDTQLVGMPADILGARIGQTYRDNWAFLDAAPRVWADVAGGAGVIINEQLARRAGLWVGDTLTISSDLTLPITGIYGDYGNPKAQAIVAEGVFYSLFPDQTATRFGLRTDAPQRIRQMLIEDFRLSESSVVNQSEIKAFSLAIFERTFVVTGALNFLTLGVAAFAILMSLLTLAAMRLPQLAPVWALGITRRTLAQVEIIRALALTALTAVLALPLGLALAWVLLAVVNVEAFGWRLPMFLFPAAYLKLGLLAMLAAALAALWPAWRLYRTPPSQLLKVFAHER